MSNINNRHRLLLKTASKYFYKYKKIIYKDWWTENVYTNITIKPEWPIYLYYRLILNRAIKYSKNKRVVIKERYK